MEFEVEDVTAWALDDEEWQGAHSKVWLTPPRGAESGASRRWLFKQSRRVLLPDRLGRQRHFTWFDAQSELIAFELAQRLGIPSATIRMVRREGTSGCISRDVRPDDEDLHSADTYLSGLSDSGYIPNAVQPVNRAGHRAHVRWGGPWLDRLRRVKSDDEWSIVERVPGLSHLCRTFVARVLEENRRRLLER